MRVLAIDPGYERLGVAILEKKPREKETLLFSNCFKTSSKEDFVTRLFLIGDFLEKLIREYQPSFLSIENLFLSNNQKTVMRVSEVRGAVLYICKKNNLSIYEFTPLQIKTSVTGSGKSDKNQVTKMIHLLLPSLQKTTKKTLDDEYDAIAAGLTFFANFKGSV